jgi:hypothetical protein
MLHSVFCTYSWIFWTQSVSVMTSLAAECSRGDRVSGPDGSGYISVRYNVKTGSGFTRRYLELFSHGYSDRSVKLTTRLHLVPEVKEDWKYTSTRRPGFIMATAFYWCYPVLGPPKKFTGFTSNLLACILVMRHNFSAHISTPTYGSTVQA